MMISFILRPGTLSCLNKPFSIIDHIEVTMRLKCRTDRFRQVTSFDKSRLLDMQIGK